MKKQMEHVGILSLSLLLVSTFAVSPAIPQMIAFYAKEGISSVQVDSLITVTSFAIMVTLLLNPLMTRFLKERHFIVFGLVLLAFGGSLPVWTTHYAFVWFSRLLLGFGIGLINARAINIIGSHYSGHERIRMMGLRGSMEVLGSAALTLLVGWLTQFGWQKAFLVYLLALVVLGMYLLFVPDRSLPKEVEEGTDRLSAQLWKTVLSLAFLAFFVINVNTFITIRIPVIVEGKALGTTFQASVLLSLMQLMGIVSGAVFGVLVNRFKDSLMAISYSIFALSIVIIAFSQQLLVLGIGAMMAGFFYSVVLNIVFSQATEKIPLSLRTNAMTIVLVGCNIGGATASLLPRFLEALNPTATGAFGVYAVLSLVLSLVLLIQVFTRK